MTSSPSDSAPVLSEIIVRPIERPEQGRYQALMAAHHYLGALPRIGETLWYVALWRDLWLALISFSGAAGHLDWLGLPHPVRPAAADCQ